MNRRPLVILALVVASFVASACTSATAPAPHNDDTLCRSGYVDGGGRCVENP